MHLVLFLLLLLFSYTPDLKAVSSVTPPQGVAPVYYIMHDRPNHLETYLSQNRGAMDGAGALGGWAHFSWKRLEPSRNNYDWSPIEDYLNSESNKITTLKNGQRIKKPLAVTILLLGDVNHQGGDLPDYVFENNKEYYRVYATSSSGQRCDTDGHCGTDIRPPWEAGSFKTGFENMIKAFAEKYDNDPRINSIWIASGLYGETVIETFNGVGCGCKFNYSGGGNYGNWLTDNRSEWRPNDIGVINIYRKYFRNKPLFIINSAPTGRMETTNNAIQVDPPVGIKYNALLHDGPHLNTDPNAQWPQTMNYWKQADESNKEGMSGFEHAYAANMPDTYWSMLTALSRRTTLIDLPIGPNSELLVIIAQMQKAYENAQRSGITRDNSADYFPLWGFMENHFGRNAFNTPDLWIVLRDTESKTYIPPWGNRLGEPGDYEFFLYRPEKINYPYDSGFGKGQSRPQDDVDRPNAKTISVMTRNLPTSDSIQFISWGKDGRRDGRSFVRRTDQNNNNRYMYFQADNRWPAVNEEKAGFDIEITFYDLGSDTFSLKFGTGSEQTITKTKQNTKKFVKETFSVPADIFKKSINSFGDHFRLDCNLDGDEYIHMVRIIPKAWQAPLWNFGPLAAGGTPYPTATRFPTSTPDPRAPTATPTTLLPTQTPTPPVLPTVAVEPGSCSGCYGLIETCRRGCASPKTCVIPPGSTTTCGWDAIRCCTARSPFTPPTEPPPQPTTSIAIDPSSCTGCYGFPQTCLRGCPLTTGVCVIPSGSTADCGYAAYRCCRPIHTVPSPSAPVSTPTSIMSTPTPPPVNPESCTLNCYGYIQTCLRGCSLPNVCVIADDCGYSPAYRCCRPARIIPTPTSTLIPSPSPSPSPAYQFQCHCSRTPDLKPQGDANCDGLINETDFSNIWKNEFVKFTLGQSQTLWRSDFNCDQTIDIEDFNIWKSNWIR